MMKIIDVIGAVLIILAILLTVLSFIAQRRSIAGVKPAAIHDIAPRGAGGNL